MENNNKKLIVNIFIFILLFGGTFYVVRTNLNQHDELNSRMYYDFENYGKALEELNDDLARIIVLMDCSFSEKKAFMNEIVLQNYRISKMFTADVRNYKFFHEYQYLYRDVDDVMDNIFIDDSISPSEERYLRALYNYNGALINDYIEFLGTEYDGYDYDQLKKLQNKIADIYEDFSNKAESLLDTEEYSFLKGYKGDFAEADFLRANKFAEEIFSKIVPNQSLAYDNRDEVNNDKFIFTTNEDNEGIDITDQDQDIQYSVEYKKYSKEVRLSLTSYTMFEPSQKYAEEELDALAEEIISKFDNTGYLYDKEVVYSTDDDSFSSNSKLVNSKENKILSSITYSYIERIDDVYDEQRKILLTLESCGLLSDFYIIDRDDVIIDPPMIQKEEILEKIKPEYAIQDIIKVRNLSEEMEYEVHLSYQNTNYAAVFDGDTGGLNYFGRDIRNY